MWREPPLDLKQVPAEPGVYRMLDGKRKVLYVGKARNLRKRIASYFQRRPESPRTEAMVQKVCDVSFTVTVSEAEALIVEHNLIKQLKPRYNVLLKDAKSYPYILLTDEDYPRLKLYRGNRDEPGEYFGPFPNAGAVHATLHIMQKIFRIRDCENTVFAHRSRPCMQYQIGRCSAPCCDSVSREEYAAQVEEVRDFLKGRDRQLLKAWEKDMQAASENLNYEQAALLRDRIRALRTILAGADSSTLPADADAIAIVRHAGGVVASIGVRRSGRDLGTHTVQVAQAWDADDLEILQSLLTERYRKDPAPDYIFLDIAVGYINNLKGIMGLVQPGTRVQILSPRRGARATWLKQVHTAGEQAISSRASANQQPAFEALARLLGLEDTPQMIAAVDNAHLGGKQMVAAIVYAGWDGTDKSLYRRYRLDDVPPGDDYAAMGHVLTRFFRAIHEDALPEPDLMLIDGGRGQLRVAMEIAAEHGLSTLRLVGVAKGKSRKLGEETLWPGWHHETFTIGKPLRPGKHSPALLLMARVRDEAHRFAGSYMRKRRKKGMFTSALDGIPGIGPGRRTALLKHFGGIEGVKRASKEGLCEVEGISRRLADQIFRQLHQ